MVVAKILATSVAVQEQVRHAGLVQCAIERLNRHPPRSSRAVLVCTQNTMNDKINSAPHIITARK